MRKIASISIRPFFTFIFMPVFAAAIFGSTAHANPLVIYGTDDRKEIYQTSDPAQQILAESVVAILSKTDIKKNGARDTASVLGESYGDQNNLCPSERFREQRAPAYCSGFLVGEDIIATAGHCVTEQGFCSDARFVFGFMLDSAGRDPNIVETKDVYGCKKVLADKMTNDGSDYALVQLDRKVVGREVLKLAAKPVGVSDPVFVIGHPSGLPAKVSDGANVRSLASTYFVANLDTFTGNSGSAVFNSNYEVAGILVRGEEDFADKGNCSVSYHCKNELCRGEDVTQASVVRAKLRQILGN